MLNEEENKYFEKWTYMQRNQQFQKRIILSLLGLVGILGLIVLLGWQQYSASG
jgi:cell division protein FtsB